MAAKPKHLPYCTRLEVFQWHERDRNHVGVRTVGGKTVADWWDDEVHQMVEDGFFKTSVRQPRSEPIDKDSVLDYLASVGVCRKGTPGPFAGTRKRR